MDGWDFVGHPVTDESAKEAIEQLKRQNDILTGIAAGNAGAEFVDAIFDGLLDGQNTSEVFWNWWPLSTGTARQNTSAWSVSPRCWPSIQKAKPTPCAFTAMM